MCALKHTYAVCLYVYIYSSDYIFSIQKTTDLILLLKIVLLLLVFILFNTSKSNESTKNPERKTFLMLTEYLCSSWFAQHDVHEIHGNINFMAILLLINFSKKKVIMNLYVWMYLYGFNVVCVGFKEVRFKPFCFGRIISIYCIC